MKIKKNIDSIEQLFKEEDDKLDKWADKVIDEIKRIQTRQAHQRHKYGIKLAPIPEHRTKIVSIFR